MKLLCSGKDKSISISIVSTDVLDKEVEDIGDFLICTDGETYNKLKSVLDKTFFIKDVIKSGK